MKPKIKFERRRKGRKRYFTKRMMGMLTFFFSWILVFMFFAGAEINYNREKAKKARLTFWGGVMNVVRYIGDCKKAIF